MADAADALSAWERRFNARLPADMAAFHARMDGGRPFSPMDSSCTLMPLREVVRARMAICGRDSDDHGRADIVASCDVRDGNHVGLRIAPPGLHAIVDCFHETFGADECAIIADGFTDFLSRALASGDRLYWL